MAMIVQTDRVKELPFEPHKNRAVCRFTSPLDALQLLLSKGANAANVRTDAFLTKSLRQYFRQREISLEVVELSIAALTNSNFEFVLPNDVESYQMVCKILHIHSAEVAAQQYPEFFQFLNGKGAVNPRDSKQVISMAKALFMDGGSV